MSPSTNEQEGNSKDNDENSWRAGRISFSDLKPDLVVTREKISVNDSPQHRSPSPSAQQSAARQMSQMQYNSGRLRLSDSIGSATSILQTLQNINEEWPIQYPWSDPKGKQKAPLSKVPVTNNMDVSHEAPTSDDQGLSVLKLDIQLGTTMSSLHLLSSLDNQSVASLLGNKLLQVLKHLKSLGERLEDTSSKVLVTGDLNAGKSTFCNALMRCKVLPEDQQPCTRVFCEIMDCLKENNGVEEVHAVLKGLTYSKRDERTFERYDLDKLVELVGEVKRFSILKVYVHDARPPSESLLRNGIVDISLIDAPGLNRDLYQTTELFSRQEEIDLVVFVVSAENHFTLSAQAFIENAAHEKSFIFIVVNRFDEIENKEMCMNRILQQVAELSPETHKDAREFVHFVSSRAVIDSNSMPEFPSNGSGGDDGGGDDPPAHTGPSDNRFDRLESSLRDFVLKKRSVSKLAPVRTYLLNLLSDVKILADVNVFKAKSQLDECLNSLSVIKPKVDELMSLGLKLSDRIHQGTETISEDLECYTRGELTSTTLDFVNTGTAQNISFDLLHPLRYGECVLAEIVTAVYAAVDRSESYAKKETAKAVQNIQQMGRDCLGDQKVFEKVFLMDAMFTKPRNNLGRSMRTRHTASDFFDLSHHTDIFFRMLTPFTPHIPIVKNKEVIPSNLYNLLTFSSLLGCTQLVRYQGNWIRYTLSALNILDWKIITRYILPTVMISGAAGVLYFVLRDVKPAISRNLSRKVHKELTQTGYIDANASRIARECRKVLKYPAQDVRACFQREIESQARVRDELDQKVCEADKASAVFGDLLKEASDQYEAVHKCLLGGLAEQQI